MKHHYRLLIIDDEIDILTTYRDYFSKRGFFVDTADNGVTGLDKLRTGDFDVAIIDIKIPKMNGMAVIHQANQEGIGTEIIILTGHGDREDAVAAVKARVSDWFDKSAVDMPNLLSKIKELSEGVPIQDIRRLLSIVPENN